MLLQESKVMGCRAGQLKRLRLVADGPELFVYFDDMTTPVLREFDDTYNRPGRAGLWKDHRGTGTFDNVSIDDAKPDPKRQPPSRVDWSWVRGAVYVRSNAVNAVQMWADYWPHVDVVDRELSDAQRYGFNMVQVYLHWIAWDGLGADEYLKRIDDFVARAEKHGLKVNFVLWDDCGHVEPSLDFAAPVPGRHNSQMMPNPSHKIRDNVGLFALHEPRFRAYVTGVAAHFKNDGRIAFWQLYNEPMGPPTKYRDGVADTNLNRLIELTRECVKSAGATQPVTATGGAFYGPKYSDFYSFHSYSDGTFALPGADGGPDHLCTETLNRPGSDVHKCLRELAGKRTGFVVWELMIGRDNCRFPWGHPDGPAEPAVPFHGVLFPDGHPWSVDEMHALLGDEKFAALQRSCFDVDYFDGRFETSKKKSITPRVDFDLGDEPGTGSPDITAGVGRDHFSIRWTGHFAASRNETRTFACSGDGEMSLKIDDQTVVSKSSNQPEATGTATLVAGKTYRVTIEYVHTTGPARAKVQTVIDGKTTVFTLPTK
ncbi:MAG: PA14 domain-containing protein [Tepidisphaeraceae bacterium]